MLLIFLRRTPTKVLRRGSYFLALDSVLYLFISNTKFYFYGLTYFILLPLPHSLYHHQPLFILPLNELYDCFFLTDDKVQRQFNLDAFDTVKSTLKGNYVFKQGKEYQIELRGILVISTPSAKKYTSNNSL